jgi:hypothetical protein
MIIKKNSGRHHDCGCVQVGKSFDAEATAEAAATAKPTVMAAAEAPAALGLLQLLLWLRRRSHPRRL